MDKYIEAVIKILKGRMAKKTESEIVSNLEMNQLSQPEIDQAMNAIEKDCILEVRTMSIFTPISPIIYRFGTTRIEQEVRTFFGMFPKVTEIGLKSVDSVEVQNNIISADLKLIHADDETVSIKYIRKSDAENIRKFYSGLIEVQREEIVMIDED